MKFLIANPSATTLVLAIAILSLLHAASVAVVVPLIPLVFPPGTRATGLALTYALGVAIFGGTATYVVTWLVGVTGGSAGVDLLCDGGECGVAPGRSRHTKFRLYGRRLAAAVGSRSLATTEPAARSRRRRSWTGFPPKKPEFNRS